MSGGASVLDQFTAFYADDQNAIVSLTAVKLGSRPVVVQGVHLSTGGTQTQPVFTTAPISDWMIEYGANPGIWVVAGNKWYKLLRPAPAYATTHADVQRKLDLCARSAHILRQRPDLRLEVVGQLILHPSSGPMGSMGVYTVQDLQQEAPFMVGQLAMLAKRLNISSSRDVLPPLITDLTKMCTPEAVQEIQMSLAIDDEEEEDDDDEDDERAAKRARTDARDVHDHLADAQRGTPPPACTDWRVEPYMVPDLLMIWEMCMAFSHLLQLPPIQLHQLEAAIMPGPIPLRASPHPTVSAPSRPRTDDPESQEKEFLAGPGNGPEPSAPGQSRPPYNLNTLLDPDGCASGVILRDIHHALIKVIDGFSTKRLHDPPEQGKLAPDDNKSELWQERVVNTLLDPKTAQEFLQPGVKAAAEAIRAREYYTLSAAQRLAILRSLCDLALNSEVMRDYVAQKAELVGASKPRGGYHLLAADPDDDKEEAATQGVEKPAALSAAELQDPDTWQRWIEGCRGKGKGGPADMEDSNRHSALNKTGVRRPLGTDLRGRRYWAFGHKAGCWRIFVEGPEASAWGWYEGAHIPKLVQWLKSANIERETSLRRALEAVPIPMKFNSDPVPPTPLPLAPAPSGDVKPTVYWTPTDLKNRRPDGYKLLDAPLLRGEYHQQVPSGLKALGASERLVNACESLLTEFDFFLFGKEQLAEMIKMLLAVQSGEPAEQAKAVLRIDSLLHDSKMTTAAWNDELRDVWQRSLQREGLTSKDVAMHFAALQYHLNEKPTRLTRLAFMRQIAAVRCPLLIPQKDDSVVFMRTGCLLHLDKYAGMGQHYNVQDIQRVKEEVSKLRPVEHCKVIAIGYRSYAGGTDGNAQAAANPSVPGQPPAAKPAASSSRPYCLWMVLQQMLQNGQPGPVDQQGHLTCVPIHIDMALPDYIVKPDTYMKGMIKTWAKGERFRMYFGGKAGSKTGGTWYKGTVVDFVGNQGQEGELYDPWDSIIVQWDADDGSSTTKVNPWEIEVDPDEAKAREAERRKAEEAAARARRAEEKQRRSAARMKAILENELEDEDEESSESISDDDIEDEDSDGRRRRYTKRKAPAPRQQQQQQQQQQSQPRLTPQQEQQLQHFRQLNAQHQQHHAQLVQQLQHLQSVGQGQSPIAQQVLQAIQQLQTAQQQMLGQMQQANIPFALLQQGQPQAGRGGQPQPQQARPGPQNQMNAQQLQQQQMMQQARPQGGMVPQNQQQQALLAQQQALLAQQRSGMVQLADGRQVHISQLPPAQQQLVLQQQQAQQQQLMRAQQAQQQGFR